jgi:lysyl-tRNA synthetase class I
MNLKNYTTEVQATKSIDGIEKLLVEFGASNIMKEYDELKPLVGKRCMSISFIVQIDGMKMPFKLPANVSKVAKWLKKKKPNSTEKTIAEQAEKIAWKQQHEILHLQLGQIEMDQLDKLEVFMAYLYDVNKQQSFYEKVKASGYKALLQ